MEAAAVAAQGGHAPPAIPEFEIIPRKGLIVVAAVLAGLLTVIAVDDLWALEFAHVAFGAGWTILDLFLGFGLGPIMAGCRSRRASS